MKRIFATFAASFLLIGSLFAQPKKDQIQKIKSGVIVKMTPIPFLFETGVGGEIILSTDSLIFNPNPCKDIDNKFSTFFPCNNNLIRKICMPFDSIKAMRRRNYLFIIPNRLLIKTKENAVFIFVTYKRKKIIDLYKRYKHYNL